MILCCVAILKSVTANMGSRFKKCILKLQASAFFISNTLNLFKPGALYNVQLQDRGNQWKNDLV
jgi:hypothetical protein